MLTNETNGRLIVNGEIAVDGEKYPHLRRALERGRKYLAKKGLIACANGQGTETMNHTEDAMAKSKKAAKAKAEPKAKAKAEPKAKAERKPKAAKAPKERDPRLPAPGSTIEREYKDRKLSVKVLEEGFEFEGTQYSSLTAVALKITGFKAISGPAFFKLTEPKPVEAK